MGEPTSVIREGAIRKAPPDPAVRVERAPKRHLVDRAIQRARKRTRPADPPSIFHDLDKPWMQANASNLELIGDIKSNDARIIIWTTHAQFETLMSEKLWFCDGTFKVGQSGCSI